MQVLQSGNWFSPQLLRKTRAERHIDKAPTAQTIPVSVATVNFRCDGNIGFIIRAMACFGSMDLHIIGAAPNYRDMVSLSGGLNRLINITQHKNPSALVEYTRAEQIPLVSVELDDRAIPLSELKVEKGKRLMLVLGHETTGVPEEILHASDMIVYIPMPGVGFCLNTSQAGNIVLYELAKQLLAQ